MIEYSQYLVGTETDFYRKPCAEFDLDYICSGFDKTREVHFVRRSRCGPES